MASARTNDNTLKQRSKNDEQCLRDLPLDISNPSHILNSRSSNFTYPSLRNIEDKRLTIAGALIHYL